MFSKIHGETCKGKYPNTGNQIHSRLYRAWHHLKDDKSILIDDNWKNSFVSFRDWALSHGYDESNDYTHFKRKVRQLGWTPDNTIISPIVRESHVFLTYNGITMTMSDWARKIGITKQILHARINRCHWPVEKALTFDIPNDPDCLFD